MTGSTPRAVAFAIQLPIARSDLPGLCDRVCDELAATRAEIVDCGIVGTGIDAVTVEALARLQLAARGRGCRIRLRGAPADLRELVAFMGLRDVFVA